MDELYTLAAARYVELNPVRAGLVSQPQDYPWSSARAHLIGRDDGLARTAPLLARVDDWAAFLGASAQEELGTEIHAHANTGRPLGGDEFVDGLENRLGRVLRPRKPGPPPGTARVRPKSELSIVSPDLALADGDGLADLE
jgi:putative transposase